MQTIRTKRGLDLPISGAPRQRIEDGPAVQTVAVVGPDYVGMKPTMAVQVGDRVAAGQMLLSDKKTPGVVFTAPGGGEVVAINRGAKRALQSVVIRLEGDDAVEFARYSDDQLEGLTPEAVRKNLVDSGLWTALRTRPFSQTPSPESTPASIFVTAIDTNPLAADPQLVIAERPDDFTAGLKVLSRLGASVIYLCKAVESDIPGSDVRLVSTVEIEGPHPAGLPGTHIHFVDPVGRNKTVWHINYQDVMAVGKLFLTGRLDFERVVALAGPAVKQPRLIRTRLGANIDELIDGELLDGENRVISGSVIAGRAAAGPLAFLGRYHLQISALAEGRQKKLFGWMGPGFGKFSIKRVFAGSLLPGSRFAMTTTTGGGARAIVPVGSYEKVMPLDILPTFLLRALEVDDVEQAEALGCLELDEDDLALCTFVCPGKGDHGAMLRRNLTTIEKEG